MCPRSCTSIDAKGQLIYETCIDRRARIQRGYSVGIERELRGKKKEKTRKRKIDLASLSKEFEKINGNTIERRPDRYFSRNLSKNSIYLVISSG